MPSTLSPNIVMQTQEFAELAENPQVLPIFVGSLEAFENAHIPGAVHIAPSQLVCGIPPGVGKIADISDLNHSFSAIGLSKDSIVIAHDDEGGGWAGRLIWTLDVLSHPHYHFLDGGINAWQGEGRAVQSKAVEPTKSQYSASIDTQQLVSVQSIVDNLNNDNLAIWDARSPREYEAGHMPGAKNLDWLELMNRSNYLRLKPLADIKNTLESLGVASGKDIITHCQSHHRSGLTYLVGKILGLNIKAYDGSWSEWGSLPDTPKEQ